jgi:hypothetical protein
MFWIHFVPKRNTISQEPFPTLLALTKNVIEYPFAFAMLLARVMASAKDAVEIG